ncbi:GNAT family N-acetyltransferase [Aminobacter sp. AP02]|uniref:GNAT family N-acetyltransferase n=1 Tax=Aminobacter sp. AP02 TaxID=2135737 RepID=UPI000D6CDD9C|nr:GNAT family N-acetyltransferase [Aminobacter sp. AP02]PWK69761.1 acetyltransferase (GNAT) family protein [Aminobacter sp. AP02]
MAGDIIIRRADRRDAAEIAILVDLSSHGLASWLWYGAVLDGSTQTALEHGRNQLRCDDDRAGWKNASLAEVDGEIAGLVIGHVVEPSFAEEEAPHPVFEPILVLQQGTIGHWFIDSVGVYSHHRGKGIGRKLVEHELKRTGALPVSLITESDNDVALGLYKSCGFEEVARRPSVTTETYSKQHDWVLLTRSAT